MTNVYFYVARNDDGIDAVFACIKCWTQINIEMIVVALAGWLFLLSRIFFSSVRRSQMKLIMCKKLIRGLDFIAGNDVLHCSIYIQCNAMQWIGFFIDFYLCKFNIELGWSSRETLLGWSSSQIVGFFSTVMPIYFCNIRINICAPWIYFYFDKQFVAFYFTQKKNKKNCVQYFDLKLIFKWTRKKNCKIYWKWKTKISNEHDRWVQESMCKFWNESCPTNCLTFCIFGTHGMCTAWMFNWVIHVWKWDVVFTFYCLISARYENVAFDVEINGSMIHTQRSKRKKNMITQISKSAYQTVHSITNRCIDWSKSYKIKLVNWIYHLNDRINLFIELIGNKAFKTLNTKI